MATFYTGGDFIKTSIHGRRIGLDNNDVLSGVTGYRSQVEFLTSADTALYPAGVSNLNASSSSTSYTLTAPSTSMLGVRKTIVNTGGAINKITLGGGNFYASTGSTTTVLTSTGINQLVELTYITASLVAVTANVSSVTFA